MRAPLMPSLFPRNDKSERKVGRKSFPRPILRRFCARVQRKSIMSQCRKANLLETRGKKERRGRVSTVFSEYSRNLSPPRVFVYPCALTMAELRNNWVVEDGLSGVEREQGINRLERGKEKVMGDGRG